MNRRLGGMVLRTAALVGFVMSSWLLVQYLLPPGASTCGAHGGCNAVRACWLGRLGGELPFWPMLGILSFATLLYLSLSSARFATAVLPLLGGAGAVVGLGLFVAQRAACHAFCPYCIVSDVSGIVAGIAAFAARPGPMPARWPQQLGFGGIAAFALVGSFYWGMKHSEPPRAQVVQELPAPVAREQRSGVATVVEFADFECPYCRRQHRELSEALPPFGDRVRLVRKHVPLGMHPHAEDAARAACCAEEQGRREAMAEALFTSEDLTPAGCEAIASRLGLNLDAYRACLHAPRTDQHIENDRTAAIQSDVRGLPTMFIGNERFDGVIPASTIRQSVEHALNASGGPRS